MKKILLSIATLGIVGAAVIGGTTAIFSDAEVSTGNTFTAGAIDLKIDNESYYNGEFNQGTSWLEPADLDGHLFFDFRDLKPGDWGEDTISLHVNNNPSWLCVDVTLTSNQDNGSTEPEENDEQPWTAGRGELADEVDFIWWADDGDNVYETGEVLLPAGPLGYLGVGQTATIALADSDENIWYPGSGDPLPGDSTHYIGKAWCFGEYELYEYPQDGPGNPDGGPVQRPIICDGALQNNSTQTDSLTADITFRAEQARHQDDYQCVPETQPTTAVLTVDKRIVFTSILVPGVVISDFTLNVTGPGGFNENFTDEIPWADLGPGTYTVTENYTGGAPIISTPVFGLDCNSSGKITLVAGDNKTCQVTNEISPS